MATSDIYSLSIRGTLFNQDVVNTWGFVQTSALPGFTGQVLVDEWQAACLTAYRACLGTSVTLTTMTARDVFPENNQIAEESLPGGTNGTGAGPSGSSQVAAVLTWRTNLAGRAFRGRTYLPGIPSSNISNGLIIASQLTLETTFIDAMINTFGPSGTSDNFQLGIISRFLNGVERPNPVITSVQLGVPRNVPGTIRRRRIGVGS